MTSTTHLIERVAHTSIADEVRPLGVSSNSDRKSFTGTMLVLVGMYLLLQNPYWVPGGDSEVYVAMARNLATGQGLLFNGQPVAMVPPGWSLVMAGVMMVIPTFLALKLVAMASMVVALGSFYWILRRFVTPFVASACVLISGVLSHVYSLTFWLHSDAFFVMLCALTILVGMQISEGRPLGWRLPVLLILCAASVFVRWAGVLNWLLVAAVLLRGELLPRPNRNWVVAFAAGVVTAITFLSLPPLMKAWAPPPVQFDDGAVLADDQTISVLEEGEGMGLVEGADDFVAQSYKIVGTGADMPPILMRLISWGTWFSFLLWQPLRLGISFAGVWWVATLTGWMIIAVLLVASVSGVRRREWLLAAVMLYTLLLSLRWTHANARYVVPMAPLILMGLFAGAAVLGTILRGQYTRNVVYTLLGICLGSAIVCNLLLYGVDVWVMRSENFYDRYEGGLNKSLIVAAQYLDRVGVGHGQVAINPRYQNLGRTRNMPTGLRGFTMLTGKAMISVPKRYLPKGLPRYTPFRIWLGEQRIYYYLDQPPVSPWRVWHFRVPWLQAYKTGEPPRDTGAGWRLYRCDGKSIPLQVQRDDVIEYPSRVPGL